MTFEELKDKALSLPYEPGVYLMQDKTGTVIYVGKAKKLKNRVSQYFQDTASHTPKTRKMVSQIDHFDTIVARSEFEALVLECSLIKRHTPKYNILLKDDKGYPYLRVDLAEDYPTMQMVSRITGDKASYFGPFGGRFVTQHVIDTLRLTLKLPSCSKQFPRDLGKERPCLNYHMNNCDGWCQLSRSQKDYHARMEQAVLILQGNYKQVAGELRAQMETAADKLQFELAASLRDRLRAVESLGEKQLVTAGTMANTDVIGYYQNETRACFAVLHYVNGSLLDKEYEILATADDPKEAVSSLVKQFYLVRGAAPKVILTPFEMEDAELFSALLQQELGKKVLIRMPQRGDNVRLVELAQKNAREEAERITTKAERRTGTLGVLADMLHLPDTPHRMESYDISNLAGTDIVASMVVFQDGKPLKSAYKRFKVEGLTDQDDYASMHQVLLRRLTHYVQQDAGFAECPDVLLIDGGIEHARVAEDVLQTLGLSIPTYGMVKDDRHRTRALVTAAGDEIAISAVPSVFALIGTIQEETHRFAITYQRTLRSRRMKASGLEDIPGIGEKRRQALLKKFRSVKAISQAGQAELERVLPVPAAQAVYRHFHPQEGGTACASSQEPPEASR
ncbi:MAG: excinuclease ABC subunit UvrC [Clostridiales bacterium]|nr:excinuclease ABC subunit UvrC [Clostridiales bacterium]